MKNKRAETTYWLDLFTGTTWREFVEAGAGVTGFRSTQVSQGMKINKGDMFLCYLTGVMRWVGILEVIGQSSNKATIWKQDAFPVRFDVKPHVLLDPEHGVLMGEFEGKVSFFGGAEQRGKFNGLVRRSPNAMHAEDGDYIVERLRQAKAHPVSLPVDPKKLARKPLFKAEKKVGKQTISAEVSVPEADLAVEAEGLAKGSHVDALAATRHTEIQYHLLTLGAEMGLDVWVARNDRSRRWANKALGALDRMVDCLPTQFNEATNRTIELIDVLWLKGNSIVAAFEVECTTSIYSGLLRMSDLLSLQPNLEIRLYLVAPDERRPKVEQEIMRPTFELRERPLSRECGYLCFTTLVDKVEGIRKLGIAASLKPEFLEGFAEFFSSKG